MRARHSKLKQLLLLCLLGATLVSSSQTNKNQLEAERQRLSREIQATEKQIREIANEKHKSINQLTALQRKISIREQLINNLSASVSDLNIQIDNLNQTIDLLNGDLVKLKEDYSGMIRVAYKNRNTINNVMFIVSANDFNQAYKRFRYFNQYKEYREQQYHEILSTRTQLQVKIAELQKTLQEKNVLLGEEEVQKQTLQQETTEKQQLVKELQKNEKELRRKLQQQIATRERLNRAIEAIIRKEIEEARRKAAAANKSRPSDKEALTATPEALKLSGEFASNRGRLPWPVSRGIVTEHFGLHPHPILEKAQVNNNGIDIKTERGSSVKAVFGGTVSAVFQIRGLQTMVVVRHGEYCTVYAHIENVLVDKGDKVKAGQPLGTVYTDEEEGKTEVHFEIWKGFDKLDPEPWLAR